MRRYFLAGFLSLACSTAIARDVTMNISVATANDYAIWIDLAAHPSEGSIECGDLRRRTLDRKANFRLQCVARPDPRSGQTRVALSGKATGNRGKDKLGNFTLRVFTNGHNFSCDAGCSIVQRWDCGASPPCIADVTVTFAGR